MSRKPRQNYPVEDLRDKLNRQREERESGHSAERKMFFDNNLPHYGHSRDLETYEYHQRSYRGRGQYHDDFRRGTYRGYQRGKQTSVAQREWNEGRTLNIKIKVETETGNRNYSIENRGGDQRGRGGRQGSFRGYTDRSENVESHLSYDERGRGRGSFRGRRLRGGYRISAGGLRRRGGRQHQRNLESNKDNETTAEGENWEHSINPGSSGNNNNAEDWESEISNKIEQVKLNDASTTPVHVSHVNTQALDNKSVDVEQVNNQGKVE